MATRVSTRFVYVTINGDTDKYAQMTRKSRFAQRLFIQLVCPARRQRSRHSASLHDHRRHRPYYDRKRDQIQLIIELNPEPFQLPDSPPNVSRELTGDNTVVPKDPQCY
jgi:hypothetical protein